MTALEAVEAVLIQAGSPLHYREITKRALEQGLWHTEGRTPWETVNARLAVQIVTEGASCTFQRTGKGIFALRGWGLPEHVPSPKAKPIETTSSPSDNTEPNPDVEDGAPEPNHEIPSAPQSTHLSFTD